MAYVIAAIVMTLSVLEGHSLIASLFKCDISHLWCVARSVCICRVLVCFLSNYTNQEIGLRNSFANTTCFYLVRLKTLSSTESVSESNVIWVWVCVWLEVPELLAKKTTLRVRVKCVGRDTVPCSVLWQFGDAENARHETAIVKVKNCD